MKRRFIRQQGQGLIEYALILVLVALVVIIILAILGPAIGNIFSNIVVAFGGGGVISGGGATYWDGVVTITVTVSQPTTITVSGDVNGSKVCSSSGQCPISLSGPAHGSATVTAAEGGQQTVSW
jgi:pilus assembly protein Flp/PilA